MDDHLWGMDDGNNRDMEKFGLNRYYAQDEHTQKEPGSEGLDDLNANQRMDSMMLFGP